jgi:hypothetical protein
MKKHLLRVVVVLFTLYAPLLVLAQAGGASSGGAKKEDAMAKLEKMSAELQLTPDQKKQMLPILMDEAPKMKAVKTDTSLGPLQKAMKLKQIGADTDAKVKPVLTPDQWQKWEAMRAQQRQEMMQKMENRER